LWPSRGLHLMGFEIKAGRGDWLRELKDPGKAEGIAAYCDQWWVVAPAEVIVPRRHRLELQPALAGLGHEQARPASDHLDLTTFPEHWGLLERRSSSQAACS